MALVPLGGVYGVARYVTVKSRVKGLKYGSMHAPVIPGKQRVLTVKSEIGLNVEPDKRREPTTGPTSGPAAVSTVEAMSNSMYKVEAPGVAERFPSTRLPPAINAPEALSNSKRPPPTF